mmetsp:Transcript_26139/g.85956  ORF Transcript_26139/g.85956 Transcript_26139/m.85956 type:complete len:201 (-) Transcript_26139:1486-2088(-)
MPRAKARANPAGRARNGPSKLAEPGRPPQPANPILESEKCKAYIVYRFLLLEALGLVVTLAQHQGILRSLQGNLHGLHPFSAPPPSLRLLPSPPRLPPAPPPRRRLTPVAPSLSSSSSDSRCSFPFVLLPWLPLLVTPCFPHSLAVSLLLPYLWPHPRRHRRHPGHAPTEAVDSADCSCRWPSLVFSPSLAERWSWNGSM